MPWCMSQACGRESGRMLQRSAACCALPLCLAQVGLIQPCLCRRACLFRAMVGLREAMQGCEAACPKRCSPPFLALSSCPAPQG